MGIQELGIASVNQGLMALGFAHMQVVHDFTYFLMNSWRPGQV